ncbi:MAG: hypothetical protein K2P81_08745 [Bacteriovoracaceae bacterium]|nr:hypothetical protein [Bacteriovoracaceae bacterium]
MKFFTLCALMFFYSCAHKIIADGGQAPFEKEKYEQLSPSDLATYAQTVVKKEQRDPDSMSLKEFTKTSEGEIRKIGLLIVESEIQPSRSGLATERSVYLSPRGKQLLTEELYHSFFQHLKALSPKKTLHFLKSADLFLSSSYRSAGSPSNDYILATNAHLTGEDVFWRLPGKNIPEATILTPRGFQDMSMIMIPAYDLIGGAKPNQHQFHWVNDVCKEMGLDAIVVLHMDASWTRGSIDKRSKEVIPEEMKMSLRGSVIYPWGKFHQAVEAKGEKSLSKLNIPLAAYSIETRFPITLTVEESAETFESAENNIINPLRATFTSFASLMSSRMMTDILATHSQSAGEK